MRTRKVVSHEIILLQEFQRIKDNVIAEDRKLAAIKCNVSTMTISRFLNGNITNNDKAIKVLNVFKQRIANREKELKAA